MAQQNASINRSTGVNHDPMTPEDSEIMKIIRKNHFADSLFVWMISAIEIPIVILTLYALCVLIKSHRSASVFVIHLILSDLIQIICALIMSFKWTRKLDIAHFYCLIVGLYFMACVAFERYLLVSHPIWYKSHHSLKVSCVISVIIWFVPLIFASINSYLLYFRHVPLLIGCLIPYPIIILCFVGTAHGISHARSLTSFKRKFILASLFLVLLTYTFIILPVLILIFILVIFPKLDDSLLFLNFFFFFDNILYLNPLADCLLYLFMRSDVGDLMKPVQCCCRTDRHQNSRQSRDEHMMERRVTSE